MPDDVAADQPEQLYVEENLARFDDDPEHVPTVPDGNTIRADRRDARTTGHADRAPTEDEEHAAPDAPVDEQIAESYEDALRRGAKVRGEGEI